MHVLYIGPTDLYTRLSALDFELSRTKRPVTGCRTPEEHPNGRIFVPSAGQQKVKISIAVGTFNYSFRRRGTPCVPGHDHQLD